jgi:exodeoxyribonuclease V gamma subunit
MREPLPLYTLTSSAWAQALRAGGDPEAAARRQWTSDYLRDREDREPEHTLVLGGELPFAALLGAGGAAEWESDEPTRFGRYARRLWDGLLAHETVGEA